MTPVLNRPLDVRVSVVGLDSISFIGLFKNLHLQGTDFVSCANCQPKKLVWNNDCRKHDCLLWTFRSSHIGNWTHISLFLAPANNCVFKFVTACNASMCLYAIQYIHCGVVILNTSPYIRITYVWCSPCEPIYIICVYACSDTWCSHFLIFIAGVDLHFGHESEMPICGTLELNQGRSVAGQGSVLTTTSTTPTNDILQIPSLLSYQ